MPAESLPITDRAIARVSSYDALLAACRVRVQALGLNYTMLDIAAGFTVGYSSKLFASSEHSSTGGRRTKRHFSPESFDAYLTALGFDLVLVENPDKVARLKSFMKAKLLFREAPLRAVSTDPPVVVKFSRSFFKRIARLGGLARAQKLHARAELREKTWCAICTRYMGLAMSSKPKRHSRFALAAAIALATVPATAVRGADGPPLKSYNAPIDESSISGTSSGAFMAVQVGVAWSSIIKGVGAVAGGPFYCAQASAADFLNGYTLPVARATGPCMAGPPPDLQPMIAKVEAKASAGEIDPLDNIKGQKIYLFHGYNDAVVAKSVTDATAEFYRRYLGEFGRGNLYYQASRGAGHSFVVNQQGERGLNNCPANRSPFIDQCGYDQAGIILQHIYGAMRPGTIGPLGGVIRSFDQNHYTGDHIADALSMGDEGYVFVPSSCEQGAACRVHVVLHGCQQDVGTIGRLFVEQTGYNAWADANRIIVLYPQTKASPFLPFNPNACWDWWSYVEHDDGYVTKSGLQIAAIKAMLNALTAGVKDPQPGSEVGDQAELIVTDTSDTAAALAWTPVAGATSYRIWRADADNTFRVVGETLGPSYADQGLAPATPYRWQVTALVGGIEQPASSIARASTRTTPPACDTPGTCP